MSAIKFGESLSKFMIPIALLKKFGNTAKYIPLLLVVGNLFLEIGCLFYTGSLNL